MAVGVMILAGGQAEDTMMPPAIVVFTVMTIVVAVTRIAEGLLLIVRAFL